MRRSQKELASRRSFLKFLAGSPVLAYLGLPASVTERPWVAESQGSGASQRAPGMPALEEDLVASPHEAINVFDFEPVARNNLPPAHWGYLATGVDDDAILLANRQGFTRFQIRMRRLVDVRRIDTSAELFGMKLESPIVLAPAGSQRAFHQDGELAAARAARKGGHLQILSTVTSTAIEEVAEARGAPIWYQLYPTPEWRITKCLLERAEAAGCPAVALTVDLQGGSNRETLARFARKDSRDCTICHERPRPDFRRKPMFRGLDLTNVKTPIPQGITWDYVGRLKDNTKMKVLVKGIVTREDARLCVEHGADGIIVSNHGGRAGASGRSTIESLPEVVEAVRGRVPVLIDSGFRRGTDIFKALALGADAVCVGRPYLWGLAAFGQGGVETVLSILRAELELVMRQAGTTSLGKIDRTYVVHTRG
ncbi:MAG: alpha-hydroxy acid oxidase [Acidobacteriota bacterium]